eukprot:TRINITY_DN9878_c0_g1::TRINITY_DN9878_c0_g1_i1::g.2889::m.2889 TRINITY_DN9878_c0_g1::TRINITY_DN9878_c0_g1_i1::g.2889  ORF type:complete len:271 (+),score=46.24,TPR_12/PF13424.1/22,TPR_12/PF13424.1/7e+02,TPR_12/PF13424.1/2e-11,TPR_1/PF00515.23/6.7e+03,TPR_1/PF00515.23/6.3e-05,TPR_1/PF00515.23/0.45,TPR_2/PF07719.12/1e+02,TPR_2/PF07719.12/7.2e+02,TPR_2/PF07719.12/0.00016,TPR_2/PF07719.12/18,TPR_11/PF13414.1/71,TPR_11/PF13414.1/0.0034,TPR_11/PF13414.1/0.00013,Apc3/PF12895.2/6.9e+02,Apc3/PF12895.2/8.3
MPTQPRIGSAGPTYSSGYPQKAPQQQEPPQSPSRRQFSTNKLVKELFKVSLAGLEHFEANRRDASRQLLRTALDILITLGDAAAVQAEMPAIVCEECENSSSRLGRHYHAKWLCALADMERGLSRTRQEVDAANECARRAARLVEGLTCRLGMLQLSSIHHELGESHYQLSEYEQAYENFQKSLEIEERVNGSQSICVCVTLGLMAVCLFKLLRHDEARVCDKRAIEILGELSDECGGVLGNKDVARLMAERMDHLAMVVVSQYNLDAIG